MASVVKIHAENPYQSHIGLGLLKSCGDIISAVHPLCKIALISDTNTSPLYADDVIRSLKTVGYDVVQYVIPSGEGNKNINTYYTVLEFLADNEITRSDMLVSLGGGVVGDLTGFAAATYMRGIPYAHIATSLLSMVDSSIGGKTGLNLQSGKNLCGAFYDPIAVICSIETLETLPRANFEDGIGEVFKYALLGNERILKVLQGVAENYDPASLYFNLRPHIEEIIEESILTKVSFVVSDPLDKGSRHYLNLGHTIGHAIEHSSRYSISHGRAVSIGICSMARAAEELGMSEAGTADKIISLASSIGLPTTCPITSNKDLYNSILSDKKRNGISIDIIVPVSLGKCEIKTIPIQNLQEILRLGVK